MRKNKTLCVIAKLCGKIKNFFAFIALTSINSYLVLCGDFFDDINRVTSNTQSKIVDTCGTLLPLVAICDVIAIIFTRDPRKVNVEIGLFIGAIVGFLIILVINGGNLTPTLKNLVS